MRLGKPLPSAQWREGKTEQPPPGSCRGGVSGAHASARDGEAAALAHLGLPRRVDEVGYDGGATECCDRSSGRPRSVGFACVVENARARPFCTPSVPLRAFRSLAPGLPCRLGRRRRRISTVML